MGKNYTALGLMSGTSMDGVDASIIESDGNREYSIISDEYFEYNQEFYSKLINIRDKVSTKDDLKTYSGFIFYIIYSFIPIIIFFTIKKFIKKKLLIILSIIVFLFSIPLFHVAQDWSRWFSIHFHLIAFLIFFLERNNLIYIKRNDKFNKIHIFLLDKFKYTFLIFVFLYATAFHHHHFFHEGVRLELTYIKVLKKIIK